MATTTRKGGREIRPQVRAITAKGVDAKGRIGTVGDGVKTVPVNRKVKRLLTDGFKFWCRMKADDPEFRARLVQWYGEKGATQILANACRQVGVAK